MALSLNPETFVSNKLPDGEMTVVGAEFEIFDYHGKANPEFGQPTALRLDCTLADGSEHTEHLSAGSSDRVIPSEDHDQLEPQSDNVKGIGKTTTLALFIDSLVKAGFPSPKLADFRASSLVGMTFIASRPPLKGDDGEIRKKKDDKGRTYDMQYFKCEKIISLPGEKGRKSGAKPAAAAKAKSAPAPTTAAAAADTGDGDAEVFSPEMESTAMEMVTSVLSEADGNKLSLVNLKVKMFGLVKSLDAETKTAILKMANSPEWLKANGFTVTGKDISL